MGHLHLRGDARPLVATRLLPDGMTYVSLRAALFEELWRMQPEIRTGLTTWREKWRAREGATA